MAFENKDKKLTIPFKKAYTFIMSDTALTCGEKLMMIAICAYWPRISTQSNRTLARVCGITEIYAKKLIRQLKRKQKIKTVYEHTTKNGKPYTARGIVPICLPKSDRPRKRGDTIVTGGGIPQYPEGGNHSILHRDTIVPPNRNIEQKDNRKTQPAPSPVERASAALNKKVPKAKLSPAEFEQRRQQAIKQLNAIR